MVFSLPGGVSSLQFTCSNSPGQDHRRVYHRERQVQWQTERGEWVGGTLEQAATRLKVLARVQTSMEVQRGKQTKAKKQPVEVEVSACSFQLSYDSEVRRESATRGQILRKDLWVVQV